MRGPSAVRRMAAVGAVSAALAACLGAGVPALTLALRLDALERREAEGRARAASEALAFEREEHATLEEAVREVLVENAPTTGRLEIWQGPVLMGSRGEGPSPGGGPLRAPVRLESAWVAREGGPEGSVVAVSVPRTASLALRHVLGETLVATVPLIAAVAGLLAAFLLRRDLEPLRRLSEAVASARPEGGFSPLPLRSDDREIVALTEALNGWQARAASALRQESEFAAQAAHALRTPLTRLSAATASDRGPLGRSVRELSRLVEGLLVHVRVGAPLSSSGVTVNLADVAREAAAPGVVAEDLGGSRVEVVAPEEAFVRGDEALLRSAVEHLLDNAFGYTDPTGRIRVIVSPSADGREVALAVVDDGPGPDPAVLARLFEPFVRGETTAGRGGTGLGLALVRRIAEAHGGRVAARREGKGTRFEIVLPAWVGERRLT